MSIHISPYTGKLTPDLLELLLTADPSEAIINEYWPNTLAFVAQHKDTIIGIALLLPLSSTKAEIKNIAVMPEYQCKGIARDLIHEIKIAAKNQGFSQLIIGTGNSSLHQMKLYQRCGFRMASIERDFFLKYPDRLMENNIRCLDLILFDLSL